jgi:hypothetical protein
LPYVLTGITVLYGRYAILEADTKVKEVYPSGF